MTGRSESSTCIAPARSPRVNPLLCSSSGFGTSLAQRTQTTLLLTGPLNPFPPIGGPQYPQASASRPSTIAH
jgi:hypothetical protein